MHLVRLSDGVIFIDELDLVCRTNTSYTLIVH